MGIFLIIVGALGLLAAAFPRLIWQLSTAWKYEKPENVEPSSAYLVVTSLSTGLASCLLIGLGIFLVSTPSTEEVRADREQQQLVCADLLAEFQALAVWSGTRLANPDALGILAAARGVQFDVSTFEALLDNR